MVDWISVRMAFSSAQAVLATLVVRAYIASMHRGRLSDPLFWIATAFVGINIAWSARSFYWDVFWPYNNGHISTPHINIVLNTLVICTQLCAMRAKQLAIPLEDRPAFWRLAAIACYPANGWWRRR